MNKFWKWFLGIVLGLALFAAGACVGFMAQAHMGFAAHGPMFFAGGPFEAPLGEVIQVGPGQSFHGGKHHGGRFGGDHGGGHAGGLIHLVLFAGLVYGAYWLGRRNARLVLDPSTGSGQRPKAGSPTMSAPAPEAAPAKPAPKRAGKKIA